MDQQRIDEAVGALRSAADALQHATAQPAVVPTAILEEILARLERIERRLEGLGVQEPSTEWYTTEEFGRVVGKAEYTVREWCRLGRMKGRKKLNKRGKFSGWSIPHEELLRYQRDGLLPSSTRS